MRWSSWPANKFIVHSPRIWGASISCLAVCVTTAIAEAQQAVPPAPGGSNVVTLTRPLWMETALTLLMIGLALFVVCRSSNRS